MFLAIFLPFVGWILSVSTSQGPKKGFWYGWLISMLFLPVWLVKGLGSITLDLRTGGAVAGLAGFFLNDSEKIRYRFAIMDILVVSLFLTHLISGFSAGEMSAMTVPEIARRWLLPYIVGRLFLSSTKDIAKILPLMTVVLIVLSIVSVVEAGTKINFLCKIFGKSFPILDAGEGYRWGIKRAQGPLDHPIFYGLMLVMSFPWAVEAGRRALVKRGPKWWLALPVAMFIAVFCTASRGPIIAAITTIFITIVFASKKLRIPLICIGLLMGGTVYVAKDSIKEAIASSVESDEFERYVEIEGQEYRYTGTAHRELLFLVYKRAIKECPFFGYGARLRNVPIAEHLADRFSSIDNHYLLFYLQRGTAGLTLFIVITIVGLLYLVRMAWNTELPHSSMAGSMVGALLGVSALFTSVWFAPDHGAVWLFFIGLTTCLWKLDYDPVRDQEDLLDEPSRIALGDQDTLVQSPDCDQNEQDVLSDEKLDVEKSHHRPIANRLVHGHPEIRNIRNDAT